MIGSMNYVEKVGYLDPLTESGTIVTNNITASSKRPSLNCLIHFYKRILMNHDPRENVVHNGPHKTTRVYWRFWNITYELNDVLRDKILRSVQCHCCWWSGARMPSYTWLVSIYKLVQLYYLLKWFLDASFPHHLSDIALLPAKMFPQLLLDNQESLDREGTRTYVTFMKRIARYFYMNILRVDKNHILEPLELVFKERMIEKKVEHTFMVLQLLCPS